VLITEKQQYSRDKDNGILVKEKVMHAVDAEGWSP
jgi:hypothetical protein